MLERLRDILLREKERGCDDRAVMGGLEALIDRWHASLITVAEEVQASEQVHSALDLLKGYAQLEPVDREKRVSEVLKLLPQTSAISPRRRIETKSLRAGFTISRPDPSDVNSATAHNRTAEFDSGFHSNSKESHIEERGVTRDLVAPSGNIAQPKPAGSISSRPVSRASTSAKPASQRLSPAATRSAITATRSGTGLDADVHRLWGISDVYASRLRRLGITIIRDLLYHFPRRHIDYSVIKSIRELTVGEIETVRGTIWEVRNSRARSGISITSAVIADHTGTIQAIWFNQSFLAKTLVAGQSVVLSGRVAEVAGHLQLKSPDWELFDGKDTIHTGRLVPVYPLTDGITDRWMRSVAKRAVDTWASKMLDHLPSWVLDSVDLMDLPTAIAQMHFPQREEALQQATRRLAFDEFFMMQLAVLTRRREWQKESGHAMRVDQDVVSSFLASLPFSLTNAQERVVSEILADMARPVPMSRLLQGDVGSGKTVVATAAAVVAAANGLQSVIMAPTEILAEQHFRTVSALVGGSYGDVSNTGSESAPTEVAEKRNGCGRRALVVELLTGSVKKSRKDEIRERIARGEIDIIIGTQALIQEGVEFSQLGLVVVDEQHRFGVNQRATLRQKGFNPDLLVMTATPIPRTLSLTLYGDLDLSVIDELPPGRQEIKTGWLSPDSRDRAYNFMRQQITAGRQAFIICPLVEESEKIETKAAVAEHQRLQSEVFPDFKVGLLHGRMKGQEKEQVMVAFRDGELDILVSTAVVEVGIDVPNATVMLIEGADRFGLSQLHQFRGRVGRGREKSFCLLLADTPSALAEQRLMAIAHTQDGFALAEEDLRLRGPGEFFGTRQSGLPDLKVAHYGDLETLRESRKVAEELFLRDPLLEGADCVLLRERLNRFLRQGLEVN